MDIEQLRQMAEAEREHADRLQVSVEAWQGYLTALTDAGTSLADASAHTSAGWTDSAGKLFEARTQECAAVITAAREAVTGSNVQTALTTLMAVIEREYNVVMAAHAAYQAAEAALDVAGTTKALQDAADAVRRIGAEYRTAEQAVRQAVAPRGGPGGAGTGPAGAGREGGALDAGAPEGAAAGGVPAASPAGAGGVSTADAAGADPAAGGVPAANPVGSAGGVPTSDPAGAAGGVPDVNPVGASTGLTAEPSLAGTAPPVPAPPLAPVASVVTPPAPVAPLPPLSPVIPAVSRTGGVSPGLRPVPAVPVQVAIPEAAGTGPQVAAAPPAGTRPAAGQSSGVTGIPPMAHGVAGGGGASTAPKPGDADTPVRRAGKPPRTVPGVPPELRGRAGRLDGRQSFLFPAARPAGRDQDEAHLVDEDLWQAGDSAHTAVVRPPHR